MKRKPFPLPAGAIAAPLPARLRPHLAVLGELPPDADGYVFEIKYDGYRMLARVEQSVRLITRNGHDWTSRMSQLRAALEALALPPGWYDGEAVLCDESGLPDFARLQASFAANDCEGIALVLFDVPYVAGHDLRAVPLAERRALLERVLEGAPPGLVRFSKALAGTPAEIFKAACAMQLEGIVCKRADSPYVDGRRSSAWRKIKCGKHEALVIGGYVATGRGILQKLLLGRPGPGGQLVYAGSVSTGFSDKARRDLSRALAMIATEESPFASGQAPAYGQWVKALLVADVSFAEWTRAGRVRHPVYRGVTARTPRPDG